MIIHIMVAQNIVLRQDKAVVIANALAARGYFVVSIQHDLKSDPALPKTGNLFQRRKPLWAIFQNTKDLVAMF
jgi:hypothetical protein